MTLEGNTQHMPDYVIAIRRDITYYLSVFSCKEVIFLACVLGKREKGLHTCVCTFSGVFLLCYSCVCVLSFFFPGSAIDVIDVLVYRHIKI